MNDREGEAEGEGGSGELARLRAEVARLGLLAEQQDASARLQAMRAGASAHAAWLTRQQLGVLQASLFWRATMPLRVAVDLARGAPDGGSPGAVRIRRAVGLLRRQGPLAVLRRGRLYLRARAAMRAAAAASVRRAVPQAALSAVAAPCEILAPCVLIVAELSLPQCAKYRVWQKQEHFLRLGVACRVVDWRDEAGCLSAACLATQAILYRVPGYPAVMRLIEALRALSLPLAWEVDDLIFDGPRFLQNRNLDSLDPELRDGIISGVDLYRSAMLACGAGIASTPHLAEAMREAGLADTHMVENALDEETLAIAGRLRERRTSGGDAAGDRILITYGSGTRTHDADFRQAAPALRRLLAGFPQVRLRIVGDLRLPEDLGELAGQIERLPAVPYARYLELLSDSDISIAPLEPTPFNDAKSNIKFLEAAILGIASVCSPRAHFCAIVRHGENGLLADGDEAWFQALSALAREPALRARMGAAALQSALGRYAPEAVAWQQVAPLLRRAPDRRRQGRLRVLFANVYYAPRSYGGATLVTEQMARRLAARDDTEVFVFTSQDRDAAPRVLSRGEQDGVCVFEAPVALDEGLAEFDDPEVAVRFGEVLEAVRPDVVHLHSIQWLGAGLAAECGRRGIPYVVTVHDAWWLCARQFMVRGDGTYCFQNRIDLRVCQACLPGAQHLGLRHRLLMAALQGAALILSPGSAHRDLHIANGVDPQRIELAPNGIVLPPARPARRGGGVLRFAYVGGNVEIKGFPLVRRAFEALDRGDWRLVLVDNTTKLGFSSVDVGEWRVRGEISVVPAYGQESLDAFFAGIDVLLFPSQWKESFGLTVREALARDVWVVATEGGGPAEAIEDGVNGTLIPLDGRAEPLLAAIEALLDRPDRLEGYRNPRAGDLLDADAQAQRLRDTLARVARKAAAGLQPVRRSGYAIQG
jgi:glycosyltransferase involved in cell wall biosynthesis